MKTIIQTLTLLIALGQTAHAALPEVTVLQNCGNGYEIVSMFGETYVRQPVDAPELITYREDGRTAYSENFEIIWSASPDDNHSGAVLFPNDPAEPEMFCQVVEAQ